MASIIYYSSTEKLTKSLTSKIEGYCATLDEVTNWDDLAMLLSEKAPDQRYDIAIMHVNSGDLQTLRYLGYLKGETPKNIIFITDSRFLESNLRITHQDKAVIRRGISFNQNPSYESTLSSKLDDILGLSGYIQ